MRPSLRPGLHVSRRVVVDPDRAIAFLGKAQRVYATPAMASDVEYACRDLLAPHLEPSEDSVGVRIEIDHLAPTPLGWRAEIDATIAAVDGRRVIFDFEVRDAVEVVGRGRHTRFVIDTQRHAARIAAKTAGGGDR